MKKIWAIICKWFLPLCIFICSRDKPMKLLDLIHGRSNHTCSFVRTLGETLVTSYRSQTYNAFRLAFSKWSNKNVQVTDILVAQNPKLIRSEEISLLRSNVYILVVTDTDNFSKITNIMTNIRRLLLFNIHIFAKWFDNTVIGTS